MKSKKYLALFAVCLIIILGIKIPQTHAQSSQGEQIPSDLALDLDLANKNPAPNQKVIADVQTEKAQITTSTGEQVVIPIQEAVPPEIKTQSSQDAVNPDQTTSEQIVEKKETNPSEPNNQNNNKDNGDVQNNIPGTNIVEPDDNAAPPPQSSANPAGNSDQQPDKSDTPASSADTSAPSTSAPAEQSNPIPLENGNTQPVTQPETSAPPTSETPPGSESTPVQPAAGSNDSGGSDSSNGDSTAVQGVSTVSWWQIFLNKISKVFTK